MVIFLFFTRPGKLKMNKEMDTICIYGNYFFESILNYVLMLFHYYISWALVYSMFVSVRAFSRSLFVCHR